MSWLPDQKVNFRLPSNQFCQPQNLPLVSKTLIPGTGYKSVYKIAFVSLIFLEKSFMKIQNQSKNISFLK